MFNWFKKKKGVERVGSSDTPQQKLKAFVESLTEYPVKLHGRQHQYSYETGEKGPSFNDLKGLLESYAMLCKFAAKHGMKKDPALPRVEFPLSPEDFDIWDDKYYDLLVRGAEYYGLKMRKRKDGTWAILRCFNCDSCSLRVDCLTSER